MATAGGDTPAMRNAKAGLNRISKSMRRISRRVVDMGNSTAAAAQNGGGAGGGAPPGHIRLVDDHSSDDDDDDRIVAAPTPPRPPPSDPDPFSLRGRSLGFMGPNNRFRRFMAKLLGYWWVEPLLLVVIVANLVMLVIQSSRNVFEHPRMPEYYYWEDMALVGIFGIYTIEVLARIVVSGLIINPPALYQPAANTSKVDIAEEVEAKDSASVHRRRMSKSNTLDAWTELGGSLKNRAQQVLKPGEAGHRRMPTRQSTMGSTTRLSAYEPSGHHRTGTMVSGKMSVLDPIRETVPAAPQQPSTTAASSEPASRESSKILRSMKEKAIPFSSAIIVQRAQTNNYAYLRHSWNRVDLIAVVAFWISFVLAIIGQESTPSHHIYIFKALSVLRVARLLTVTSGTSTILQSLKLAAPLLSNVLFFTLFAMILFSIIGIQSFKGSYRRSCVWVGDLNEGINSEPGQNYTLSQICGGWYDETATKRNHIQADGRQSPIGAKGFICPLGQMCIEAASNPNENSQSFDNIFTSLLEVVIIISSNGWSGVMYDMIDADFFVSCLFFIFGLILLNFWLANLFVAVITNSFATISSQTHQSAFSNKNIDEAAAVQAKEEQSRSRLRRKKVANVYKRFWGYTYYIWLLAIIGSLGLQATGASYNTAEATQMVVTAELYFTIAFDCEIILRFLSYLLDDDWRSFFNGHRSGRNKVDLGLCVITSIIQIPAIKMSAVYPWLTIFQLQRFYRVIIAVPRMERLLLRVFGSLSGLLNMIVFLLLMVGLASLVAVQLFRGDIQAESDGESVQMTFKQIYNGYLAMYQIFSSENWNDVLFDVISDESQFKQAVIAGLFIGGWFLFANFIVLQMFIAVINEGFSFSEAERRRQQLDHYLKRIEPKSTSLTGRLLHSLSPYRYLKARNAAILNQSVANDSSVDSHTEAIARSMDGHAPSRERAQRSAGARARLAKKQMGKQLTALERFLDRGGEMLVTVRRILRLDAPEDRSVPLDTVRQRAIRASLHGNEMLQARRSARQPSMYEVAADDDAAARIFARERQLNRMRSDLGLLSEKPTQREIDAAHIAHHEENPRIAMAKAINEHPSFDKSLWLFSNHSRFRRFCQSMVPAAHGERIFGRQHSRRRLFITQIIIFMAIVASVIVAGVASPLYRKEWYARHGFKRDSWFSLAELFLSLVFFAEFAIKVVADGFAFTPNAYLLSPWNLLDLLVLATLVINVTTELVVIGGVSRFTRAIRAFRALRLINLSARMRSTFENLIIGGGRFVDASILAILYIIPFAVWGQNLFSGLLYGCTDTSNAILFKSDCVGEYYASPSEWTFLAPRVWQNPVEGSSYSFDDFKSALLILFEIVSLEGWIDVMTAAMAIVGRNQQPQQDARQVNALFFVIYNLIGAIFVLTLFVSVIIEGFQSATGAAFFSTEQRQWIDLKRLISRQRPSKRPAARPTDRLRQWCYDRATRKHDWWSRMMTMLYILNIVTLCTQAYDQDASAERIRDGIYLVFAIVYGIDVLIRLAGLGWNSFRRSAWCIFDSIVVVGIVANSIPLLSTSQPVQANIQLQKVFLTAATLKLVAKHNGLNQLLKTAVSGLPAIVSLLGLWLCFFFFFAIMFVEIFGLTKWGYIGPESYAKNFSSLPLTLIFLSMMSTGEGWNGYMHDYTVEPPSCTPSANYLETDCGSTGWAYFLFIAWNVTSMYIFLNMFTGTVVENFSYIFQLGGKPILGREDMRGFKKAWFDVVGTSAYLPKDKLTAFFAALPGKFELRMYPDELALPVLREAAVGDERASMTSLASTQRKGGMMSRLRAVSPIKEPGSGSAFPWPPAGSKGGLGAGYDHARRIDGINVKRLHHLINTVDATDLHERRERFNRIYHEACILADTNGGASAGCISFQDMLTLIAHYKLIDDDVALGPQELLDRRVINERIDDRINLERVRGVMATTYLRYRFNLLRAERQRASAEMMAAANLPSSPSRHRLGAEGPTGAAGMGGSSTSLLFSPSSSSHDNLNLNATSSSLAVGSGPSFEELERRASPQLEQFGDSAWGKMMRRVSVVARSSGSAASASGRSAA
ncbi:hypothetical protein BDZ90DRAFT_239367, partial [Jaminaea rosea]